MIWLKLIKNIKKRTEKIRYKVIALIIKHITPSLYNKIEPIILNSWGAIPRPAIKVMKEMFNEKSVIGAEIGVDKGVNAKSILKELNIERLYLIDAWINYKEIQAERPQKTNFESVLNKFKNNNKVEIIKAFSIDAINKIVDDSLDFVYIDANHLFEYVYQDIKLWFEKVKEGGIIAGHDIYNHSGVLKALMMFCNEKELSFNIKIPDWYFIKR